MTTIPDELVEAAKAAAAEAARPMRSFMDPVSDAAASCILANDALWRSALSAALPMLVRAEWQPIETAPDDTAILLLEGDAVFRGEYDSRNECWTARCGQPVIWQPDPTHWMPLPAPPAIATAIRARGER